MEKEANEPSSKSNLSFRGRLAILNTNIVSFLPQGSEMKPPVQKPIMVERAYSVAEIVEIES